MNNETEKITCHKCNKQYDEHLIYYLEENGTKQPICVFCKDKL